MSEAQHQPSVVLNTPWIQLLLGIVCMATVANLQYAWPLFREPIAHVFNWDLPAIEVSFTIFLVIQTWFVPLEGWLVDKYGPRPIVVVGGLLCGISWALYASTSSLAELYLAATVGGLGAGCVYGATVGNALKWFPTRRGLAVGLTAAGYGAGAALTVGPIAAYIKSNGFQDAFLHFGAVQGVIVIVIGFLLARPTMDIEAQKPVLAGATEYNARPMEVLREPTFWMMYLMFTLMVAAGTIVTGQLGALAKEYGIGKATEIPVLTFLTFTLAQDIGRVMNGLTRPIFGSISDRWGRENTMFAAFLLFSVSIALMATLGHSALIFVLMLVLIPLLWGEVYSLFPATCADSFGHRYAATNAGILYTAKGTANLLVPFGPAIILATGEYTPLLYFIAAISLIAAALALWVLKPMRLNLQKKFDALFAAGKGH
ncbi:MAG TPA: oxalate/formate MFS antiporter [Rhodocyclaceae bacterium]|nr:oxalate/formate MFS antiporter [Rhodocyclaceae bacterium]